MPAELLFLTSCVERHSVQYEANSQETQTQVEQAALHEAELGIQIQASFRDQHTRGSLRSW